ncbi:MAG: ferritin family protein [bacterium]
MSNSDPITTLNLARTAEKESLRRYLEFAWRTKDPGGKNMFIRLAMDEYHHCELIEEQLRSLTETGATTLVTVPSSLFEQLVPRLKEKDLLISGQNKQTELNALQTALELELSARKFYLQEKEKATEKRLKELLSRLEQMEQAHLQLIQAEIDYIQKTGFWFWFAEFTLEGNP